MKDSKHVVYGKVSLIAKPQIKLSSSRQRPFTHAIVWLHFDLYNCTWSEWHQLWVWVCGLLTGLCPNNPSITPLTFHTAPPSSSLTKAVDLCSFLRIAFNSKPDFRIQVLNSDLTFSSTFVEKDSGEGQLNHPGGIAYDSGFLEDV